MDLLSLREKFGFTRGQRNFVPSLGITVLAWIATATYLAAQSTIDYPTFTVVEVKRTRVPSLKIKVDLLILRA